MAQPKNGRIGFISAIVLLVALFFVTKLFFVQVLHSESYREKAKTSYIQSSDTFERGLIYFTKKDGTQIGAATITTGFRVVINPSLIIEPEGLFNALYPFLPDLNKEEFLARATKKNDPSEVIATKIPKTTADEIEVLGLKEVSVQREKWRFYPGGDIASHTIGFVAYKGDALIGRYGLEKQYNGVLARKEDELYVNFFAEIFSNIRKGLSVGTEKEGDLITTIEPNVQRFLELKLKEVNGKWSSDATGAVIINPLNGEIYAMGYYPSFDLNRFGDVEDVAMFSNPLVEHVYEFGSVVKPLVIASALDAGVITPQTTYYDGGSVKVGIETIHNFDKKGRGTVNMQEVLNQSLNTGMVFAEQKMGNALFQKYMKSYMLGERSGIDLPNEAKGLTSNLDSPRDIENATASFGQGIAFNPMEAVSAFSAMVNGGRLVTPHLVRAIDYVDGGAEELVVPDRGTTILKPETSEEISRMLVTLVDTALFEGKQKLSTHTIAGKTGTAQIPNPAGGYFEGKHLHSFMGYAPAYDPKFLILLFTEDPKGVLYASQSVAGTSLDTLKFLLSYYEVPPDR
jgi:cell division protein FtsI/penicillin-binding protein 2